MKRVNNLFKVIAVCLILLNSFNGVSYAQTTKKLKQKEARLKKQIRQTKALISKTKKSQNITLSELNIINKQITYREELLNNYNSQIATITEDIDNNSSEISTIQNELLKLKKEFKEMIRFAYKNRNKDFNIMYLIASQDFNEAYKRMKYIHQYSENRKIQVEKIKTSQQKLVIENDLLLKNKEEKLLVIDQSKTEKQAFLNDKKQQQVILNKIKSNQSSLNTKLRNQENERKKVARAIRNAIKKEMAKSKPKNTTDKPKTFTNSPEIKLAGKKFEENKGKLPWPVEKGAVTSAYGRQQHSVVSTTYIENNGIDISTDRGANVRTVFKGTVSNIFTIPGAGKAVIVSHGNYRTVYANLKEVSVTTGQTLTTKQKVGNLLPNSSDKISESHFEIWHISSSDMKTVNPASWLIKK